MAIEIFKKMPPGGGIFKIQRGFGFLVSLAHPKLNLIGNILWRIVDSFHYLGRRYQ